MCWKVDDSLLVLSELVSNAIVASPPSELVRVEIAVTQSAVTFVIENRGRVDTAALSYDLPPAHQCSGRGLAVVRALTSEFDLRCRAGITRARAVIATTPQPVAKVDKVS